MSIKQQIININGKYQINKTEQKIKNRTYYFFSDMINISNFDSDLLKMNKKSYSNIDIYYIGYTAMKDSDCVRIKSVIPLFLIISEVDGPFEEKNGNKYLMLDSTNKNKEVLKKYVELWDGIKNYIECNSIEKIYNKLGEYGKDFMKIKFNSDDNLSLNKTLNLHNITIIIRSVFEEDEKFYPQIYLDECLYEL